MSRLTHAAYKKLDRTLGVMVIGANLLGALITLFYWAVVQPIPQGSSPVIVIPFLAILVSFLDIVFLLFLGYVAAISNLNLKSAQYGWSPSLDSSAERSQRSPRAKNGC